jgi:putative transposase
MVACDFFVAVTATFRLLYVLVIIEHGSRRLVHLNVTGDATAAWTLQQLRQVIGWEERYDICSMIETTSSPRAWTNP